MFAFADNSVNYDVVETKSESVVTVYSDEGYIIETTYNKDDNTIRMITTQDDEVIEDLFIDINEEMEQISSDNDLSIMPFSEEDGKRLMSSEYTILNYEYEEWWYPNYNNGEGTFWNFRTFSNSFRLCYEDDDSPRSYSRAISNFVDSVEKINDIELIAGASVIATVGIAISGAGGIATLALKEKIVGLFVSMGVVGGATAGVNLYTAIRTCQESWDAIY